MGYKVKIQKVERGSTKSFYVNFPAAVADACTLSKGEEMEWLIEDRNNFVLRRVKNAETNLPKAKTDK
jgi:ATP-dependent protease Clp ATPase subunit